jgi:hypothetical protein
MDDAFYYLRKICASKGFVSAPRLTRFLTHVVTQTQRGETEHLHLSALADDLWGSVDKTSDVKAAAFRVRDKLATYYTTEGNDDRVRIDLPEGGYVARIEDRNLPEIGKELTRIAVQPLVKRRLRILLSDDEDLFVEVKRLPGGQLSIEVTEFHPTVEPTIPTPPPTTPASGSRAEDEFTEEELNGLVVVLVKGKNALGHAIYAYVELPFRSFIAMARKIRDNEYFRADDFGEVLANGPDEPSADLRRELMGKHGLLESPQPIDIPTRPLKDSQPG